MRCFLLTVLLLACGCVTDGGGLAPDALANRIRTAEAGAARCGHTEFYDTYHLLAQEYEQAAGPLDAALREGRVTNGEYQWFLVDYADQVEKMERQVLDCE